MEQFLEETLRMSLIFRRNPNRSTHVFRGQKDRDVPAAVSLLLPIKNRESWVWPGDNQQEPGFIHSKRGGFHIKIVFYIRNI